ncbi:hypothetical protein [Haloarcula hispanica]|uniref:hypothetical protein n=1 Tax=Haloarcula hispanica TaxID=51589 RepID=UPI0011B7024A|nr:hypothetical protein [Haloarcula hispanica]
MKDIHWYKFPAAVLATIGVGFLFRGSNTYLSHLSRNPSHELGLLAEVVFIAHVLGGLAVISVGVHSYRTERIAFPLAALVFGAVVGIESVIDGWLSWENTQAALLTLLLIAGVPAVLVWAVCRYSRIQRLKNSTTQK